MTGPAKINRVQITLSYIFGNIFSSECGISFPLISEESPLNSAVVTEILLCLYKQFVSYDRVKTEKIGNFFELTWLIFAGPITYMKELYVQLYGKDLSNY